MTSARTALRHLPNALTVARVAAVPFLAGVFFLAEPTKSLAAFLLFTVAALTDFLDGWLARKLRVVSGLGTFLDPIADKLMVGAALILLAWDGRLAGLHVVAGVVILFREIFISGLREFLGNVKVTMPVSRLAKWKTTVQLVAIAVLLGAPLVGAGAGGAHLLGLALLWLAAAMTAITGWQYTAAAWPHLTGPTDAGEDR
ncbi:cardiolipin synthase [Rhodothalassium salexigens DSM 2132]|uniref:CDP-diacylglycerol--glycerol-3-phosphate 3-phosphatidyltransferase n=1 Tax=Rhodothalassium salexigens DSM 2132 TaxID=1188247 RepID=A0A4R2PCE2_RHOSA|nr:CDP-diacylglycerol--glycerol-3-phosphate 3-phosphatidyltransferase [Rhodothalassium salexigens]MBB4212355.1 CDP-diacylglycerol--glycerol-3-phosphate 3-phosphatidyltransferase [Rhodothalassium salexigens DSM 2132]MBK1637779.1 CDP-diacylglycerol--glycerol-3-phosphate 3-phosphatidyltransferase [Rhodothalassium salexigens DSM 2132]TCP32014.1 cardiolipin synthase [Rhodothalassium salexigens DSM 2132]